MNDDEALIALAFAGVILMGKNTEWGSGWVWPVPPVLIGGAVYNPVISDGFGSSRAGFGDGTHKGVDIMYERHAVGALAQYKPGSRDGTKLYFAPQNTPVVAARKGTVWTVANTARGHAVVLSHGKPWATFYQHMESVLVPAVRGIEVEAGQIIGFMGYSPADSSSPRHLHFETWYRGGSESALDPAAQMQTWARMAPWRP